uniref:Uncharacterized protein n=1 Tax=Cannabis sativa TaxID=3483 RepID=A0A803QD35_CANSA
MQMVAASQEVLSQGWALGISSTYHTPLAAKEAQEQVVADLAIYGDYKVTFNLSLDKVTREQDDTCSQLVDNCAQLAAAGTEKDKAMCRLKSARKNKKNLEHQVGELQSRVRELREELKAASQTLVEHDGAVVDRQLCTMFGVPILTLISTLSVLKQFSGLLNGEPTSTGLGGGC